MKKIAVFLLTMLTFNSFSQNYCAYQWTRQIGGIANECPTDMVSDTTGNLYCTFTTESQQLYYQNYLLPENQESYIAKISPDGELGWVLSAVSTNFITLYRIKVTHNNSDLFVIGAFKGTAQIGDTTLIDSTGQYASTTFFMKMDMDGNFKWVKKFKFARRCGILDFALDAGDNLYFTGITWDSLMIVGNDTLVCYGDTDMPLLKYDSEGNLLWGTHAGVDEFGLARARGITIDNENNIILAGDCHGSTFIYQEDTIINPMGFYLLFMKLDSDGTLLWVKFPGCETMNNSWDVVCDSEGDIYITGSIQGDISFDTIEFSFEYQQAFFAGLTNDGEYKWVRTTETSGGSIYGSTTEGWSISCNKDDDLFVSGIFERSVKFGTTVLTTGFNLEYNAFITKIQQNGTFEWAMQIYNFAYDEDYFGRPTLIDKDNNIYTSGIFVDQGNFGDTSLVAMGLNDIYLAKLYEIETHVKDNPAGHDFKIYYSEEALYLSDLNPSSKYKITIYNLSGETVYQGQISGRYNHEFKPGLTRGIYLINIHDGKKNTNKKLFMN
jgi:hypothetical protein